MTIIHKFYILVIHKRFVTEKIRSTNAFVEETAKTNSISFQKLTTPFRMKNSYSFRHNVFFELILSIDKISFRTTSSENISLPFISVPWLLQKPNVQFISNDHIIIPYDLNQTWIKQILFIVL